MVNGKEMGFTVCPPGYVLDGWCRRVQQRLWVAKGIIGELGRYFEQCRGLLAKLRDLSSGASGDLVEVFSEQKIDDFVQWIRRETCLASASLVEGEFHTFSQLGLGALERELERVTSEQRTNRPVTIPLDDLIWKGKPLKGESAIGPGTRVVIVAASGSAPFGTFGTVVGGSAARKEVDVVTDWPQKLGSYLRGRLRTRRGFTLKKADVFPLPKR
jgi:hypothetical protein